MEETDLKYFPHNWDIDNEPQYKFYKRCLPYVESEDGFDYLIERHIIFKIFGISAITYFIILGLILLSYRNHYMLKRQGIYYYIFILGSIISSTNSFLVQLYKKTYSCAMLNFLLCIGYPLGFISYVLIILKNFRNYYNSQIAYTEMFEDVKKKKTFKDRFLFKYIYQNMLQTRVITFFVYYLIFKWLYVYLLYFFDSSFSQIGFCKLNILHLPQIFEIFFVMLIFLPLAIIEVIKFDDSFKMKKKIIRAILTTAFCLIGYLVVSLVNKIHCSFFVKVFPSDGFVILVFLCSSVYLCIPTIKEIIYVNKQKSETKATQQGMLKMLEDPILLREFGEFCMQENCAENILFYRDYWKFKKLFDNRRPSKTIKSVYHHSTHQNSSFEIESHEVNDMSFEAAPELSVCIEEESHNTNSVDSVETANYNSDSSMFKPNFNMHRKITKNDTFIKEATKIIDTYINNNSKFEINISAKIKKKIIFEFKEITNNELQQKEFKDKLTILFDEAYKEVVDSLFLNSYSNYISLKKNDL